MLTVKQLGLLEEFSSHNHSEYFRDNIYAEAINTLLDAHYLHRELFSSRLNILIEDELEKLYNYINEKYEKVEVEETFKVTKWIKRTT